MTVAEVVSEALEALPLSKGRKDSTPWNRGKKVLELLYGLNGNQPHTLVKAGNHPDLQLSKEGVRIIKEKAKYRLRRSLYRHKFAQFFVEQS